MTLSKKVYRNRKPKAGSVAINPWIKKWFAGEIKFTFHAYSFPYAAHLDEYWEAWIELHPDATMPEGLESLMKSAKIHREFIEKNKEFRGESEAHN
ncbi:MAG: hypothetical protein JW927_01385 [Deltaproteobacteria bacterium]|nr:hypothetical protein [Deltaproteobacteria bacterium]